MKFTKTLLLKQTRDGLIKSGYREFKDTITGADGLFVKHIASEYFLTLGLIKSRFYDSKFTANFYLSKTTVWSALWGDIPRKSFERIGFFLTVKERKLYLDEQQETVGGDAWWCGERDDDFEKFIKTVRITEKRFLNQDDFFEEIDRSIDVAELLDQTTDVFRIIDKGVNGDITYKFIPDKQIDGISMEWFKAAEVALMRKDRILNKNTVKRLAADAWRQKELSKL